jgi:hypothetical protein
MFCVGTGFEEYTTFSRGLVCKIDKISMVGVHSVSSFCGNHFFICWQLRSGDGPYGVILM